MPRRPSSYAAALALAGLSLVSTAHATVTEPNGLVVPRDSRNGEIQLFTMFGQRGEAIDWLADAATEPSRFVPRCDFAATFVLKQAGAALAVGWYNAVPASGVAPAPEDIHILVPPGAPVGTKIQNADIRNDPAYAGGEIGFALVGTQTHYSENRLNVVCTGCQPPAPWITTIVYASKVTPDAYYVAYEDGSAGPTPGSFSNDGDFNDFVYFMEGIRCAEEGAACTTGLAGRCSPGVSHCSAGGTTCTPLEQPAALEICNGEDDDCDGAVDEGASCEAGSVCSKGACIAACDASSCPAGSVCNVDGVCTDSACAAVSCPSGTACREGNCVEPCAGVVCPGTDVCRAGRCVDACTGVVCESGSVCAAGVCRAACDECDAPCGTDQTCDAPTGQCLATACLNVDCAAGTSCVAGACVDPCADAVCPSGQTCSDGACHDVPYVEPDAGAPDAGAEDAGIVDAGTGTNDAGGSPVPDASVPREPSPTPEPTADPPTTGGGGCGCHTVDGTEGISWSALGVVSLLALRSRRRPRER